ncbi:MAG: hypothetical protein ACRENE_22760, partial [Polyangiaceae bacterium]
MTTKSFAASGRSGWLPTTGFVLILAGLAAIVARDLPRWKGFPSSGALLFARTESAPPTPSPVHRLRFNDPPADWEFRQVGLLVQPPIPIGKTDAAENRALATAIKAYEANHQQGGADDAAPLAAFLDAHPKSAWRASLLVEMGILFRSTGHMAKALQAWQSAWALSKDSETDDGHSIGDTAAGYLSQFEAYLGQREALAPLIEELRKRPIHGSARQMVINSAGGLDDMIRRPEFSFKCGPMALKRILLSQGAALHSDAINVLDASASTPNGLSLTAVRDLSRKAGLNYRMAFRPPGAPLVVPSVMHWAVNHYAGILGRDQASNLAIADPTFGEDIRVRESTLDEEASGYFLIPAQSLPSGWREVSDSEGNTVWGRGNTGPHHDDDAVNDIKAFPDGTCKGGCTTWNVDAANVGLALHDDPVGYTPPLGPPVRLPLDYSSRNYALPTYNNFAFSNFGEAWTFGYLSWVEDDATCAGAYGFQTTCFDPGGCTTVTTYPAGPPNCAKLYRAGGGTEEFLFNPNTGTTSALSPFSQSTLTRTLDGNSSTAFTRTLSDGTVQSFTKKVSTVGIGTVYLLTQIVDPHNQALSIQYVTTTPDAGITLYRIANITDANGLKTTFCYSDSVPTSGGCSGGYTVTLPTEVTQVVDPFGRSATFTYETTSPYRLTSITDVLGLTSSFTYLGGAANPDFIRKLTTPYGSTNFTYGDELGGSSGAATSNNLRFLMAVDPMGRTSYVEFNQGTAGMASPCGYGYCNSVNCGGTGLKNMTDPLTGIVCTDLNPGFPAGLLANGVDSSGNAVPYSYANNNLNFRNTFVWDPHQYVQAGNTIPSSQSAYAAAKLMHWLHTESGPGSTVPLTASRTLESLKFPNQNRIWFDYPGQAQSKWGPISVGSTNQPVLIAQVVPSPILGSTATTTRLWQFKYDYLTSSNSPHGKVTQIIDPENRQLSFTYASNGFDLLSVENVTANEPIASFGNYNSQHEPGTYTGPNGKTTTYTYYPTGQLRSTIDPLNNVWTFVRAPQGQGPMGGFLMEIDGPSPTPRYMFGPDKLGRVMQTTTPDGVYVNY